MYLFRYANTDIRGELPIGEDELRFDLADSDAMSFLYRYYQNAGDVKSQATNMTKWNASNTAIVKRIDADSTKGSSMQLSKFGT